MALRLGPVTVPETVLSLWDSDGFRTDGATGQWSAALAPGQVGQSERGAAGTAPPRGKFHVLVITDDALSRTQVAASQVFKELRTSLHCQSGMVVSSEMLALVQIQGSQRFEPTGAGMLRHSFSETAWETLCANEEGSDFGFLMATKNALWAIRALRTETERNNDWVLVIRAHGAQPLATKDHFDQVLDEMRHVNPRDHLLRVQMASADVALTRAGASYLRSGVLTQFAPDYLEGRAGASHRFVSKQGSALHRDMFDPAVLLLHPQVIAALATRIISQSTWSTWIADAIKSAEESRRICHWVTNTRGEADICRRVGVVPILWSVGSATMPILSTW